MKKEPSKEEIHESWELFAKRYNDELPELRRIAKEKGEIVDSIEALKCVQHPDSKFKIYSRIPDTIQSIIREHAYGVRNINSDDLLNKLYCCETCLSDEKVVNKSKAYECNHHLGGNCGIVIGEPLFKQDREIVYPNIMRSHQPETAITDTYFCRICNCNVGVCHHSLESKVNSPLLVSETAKEDLDIIRKNQRIGSSI